MHSKVRGPYWLCEARQQHSDVEEIFRPTEFLLKVWTPCQKFANFVVTSFLLDICP